MVTPSLVPVKPRASFARALQMTASAATRTASHLRAKSSANQNRELI